MASEAGHCHNGGCTRKIYRGKYCLRCWAGVKWTSIMQRVQNRNGNNPSYEKVPLVITREEIIDWVLTNPPPPEMREPSIDRIIPEIGYAPGNIRWLEKRINSSSQRDIPLDKKRCPSCGRVLLLDCFGVHNRTYGRKRQSYCKECRNAYNREWHKKRRAA